VFIGDFVGQGLCSCRFAKIAIRNTVLSHEQQQEQSPCPTIGDLILSSFG
jgi:hypothetical protein